MFEPKKLNLTRFNFFYDKSEYLDQRLMIYIHTLDFNTIEAKMVSRLMELYKN